jgi:ribosomal protein S18 acetylase RimI-like enzyme
VAPGNAAPHVGLPIAPPLEDTSPHGFRVAIEADTIGTRVPGTELPVAQHRDRDADWVTGGAGDPYTNTVASARFDAATADARIAEIVAAYDALPAPFLWWRSPDHTPSDLGERLEGAHVFALGDAPAMAMDLATMGPAPAADGDLEIRGVRDEAGLRDYFGILASEPPDEGAPPQWPPDKLERVVAHLRPRVVLEPAPLRQVGYLHGRPVATARLSLAGGAAGIYAIATLPEARGRGIGARMTHAVMATGRDLGYRVATLQSSEMGYRIYLRLGFVEVFRYVLHVHIPGGERFGGAADRY